MGTGASTDGSGGDTQAMKPTRPSSAQVGTNGARKRMLVSGNKNRAMTPNASSRAGGSASANGKPSPNGKRSGARSANGYSAAGAPTVNARGGTGAARVATKHRLKLQQEEDLKVLTRNADPLSLEVLETIEASDKLPDDQPAEKLQLLQQCYPMLEKVPVEDFDQLAMTIYQKEGEIYQQQGEKASAKETYTRAITLAERRVARGDKDMYNVLKRYVMAMIGVARIWYEEERDTKGFEFVDRTHPRVAAMDANADNVSDASSSLSSLESTFSSVGSVFSLNQAILKSMAPRPPRRRTGPNIGTIKVKAPHQIPSAQLATREDEFVLYSKMTRELVASPCELLLLRCCEVVEIGLHTQSELLIPPLIELAQLYEDLALYSRALLVVRRCLGILCNVYDYDHPWVIELRGLADYLDALRQEQLRNEAATKIQSAWRMYKAMKDLEEALGRPVHRHYWIPKKYRQTPDIDFLGDLADAIPADDDNDRALPGEEGEDDASQPRYTPPRHVSPPANQYPSESPNRSEPRGVEEPSLAPVLYDPVRSVGEVATFTTMVPNAKVLGTTQDTQTDTHVQPTDKGDVLTVRTTTITKTITEKLPGSDEDEETPEAPEEPCDVPIPCCPRCERDLPVPHCDRCLRELPPPPLPEDLDEVAAGGCPRCPYCRVHRPGMTRACPHCAATLPASRRWPASGAAPDARDEPLEICERCHQSVPLDVCAACQRDVPPPPYAGEETYQLDPDGAPRCPFCRTVQPPLRCPDCDATPEEEPLAAEEEQAPRELPEEVPVPHCPRCDRELEEPQCPCCERTVPPPPPPGEDTQESLSRCPFCRVHQPVHRCFNCCRTLPLVRPEEAPTDDHRAQHQLQFCPFCGLQAAQEHCPACHREQPPAPFAGEEDYASDPSKPPRCPYCRTVQPPLRCPDCDATPEEEPLAAEEEQAPRELPEEVPVPHCPRCDRELEEPQCPCCERTVPPPPPPGEDTQESLSRCPFCRVHQPVHRCFNCHREVPLVRPEEAPTDDHRAQHQLQFCPFCGLQAAQEHCPACHREQPPAPFAGEEDYASDPSKPPRCPYCRTVQPPLRCPDCDATPEEEPLAAEEERMPPVEAALPVERGLSMSPTPPPSEAKVEDDNEEAPEATPTPHCPRCHHALEVPHCPACTMELPPPPPPGEDTQESLSRCPFCRVHQPVHRCFNCCRTLPLVRPEEAPADDHRAQHQLQFCPFCGLQAAQEHCPACHREQPPAPFAGEEDYASDPSKPPRCPYCRTVQPPLRCPYCDVPAAEPEAQVEAEVVVDPTGSDEGGEEEVLCPNCGLQELEFPPDCPFCRRALPAEIVPTEPHTEENPTDEPAPLCPYCTKVLPLACPRCDAPLPATAGATPVERELPAAAAAAAKMSPSSSRAAQTSPPPPPATMTSCSVQTVTEPAVPAQDAATMTLPEPKPEPPRKRDAQTATTPPLDIQPRAVAPPAPHPATTTASSPSASESDLHEDEEDDAGSSAYTVVSSHSSVRYEQYPGGAVPQPPQAAMPQMPGVFPGMYPGMAGAGNHYYYVYYPVGGAAMPMMMGAPGMMMPPQPQPPQPQPQPQPPMGHSRHHRYRRSSRSTRRGSKSVTSQMGPNTSGSTTLSELRYPCPSCHRTLPPLRCPECARRQPEPDESFLYDPENPPHCRACGADQPIAHCPYCFIELARVMSVSMPTTTTNNNNETSSHVRKPAPPPLPRRSSAHAHAPEGDRGDHAHPSYQPEPPRSQPKQTQEARVSKQAGSTTVSQQQNVYTSTPLRVGTPPKPQLTMKKGAGGTTVYQETTDTPGGFRIVREYTIERTRIDRTTLSDKDDADEAGEEDEGEEEEEEYEEEEETDEEDITDPEEDEEVLEMLAELRAREEVDPVLSPYRGASTSASMLPSMATTGTAHGQAGASASRLPSITVTGVAHGHAGASSSRMWNNVSSTSLSGAVHPDAGLDEAVTTTTRDVQRIPNGKRTIVQSITRRRSQMEQPSTVFDINAPGASFMYGFPNVASSGAGVSLPTLSRRTSQSGSLQKPTVPTASRAEQDNVHMYDEL